MVLVHHHLYPQYFQDIHGMPTLLSLGARVESSPHSSCKYTEGLTIATSELLGQK